MIFDWDNIFATYMTSLSSKDIAYSNFIQVYLYIVFTPAMRLEFSGPLSRKRLAFSIRAWSLEMVPRTPNASYYRQVIRSKTAMGFVPNYSAGSPGATLAFWQNVTALTAIYRLNP